jgi:hypothetical protein
MPNEALGLKTVGLSQDMEETCRTVYGEFLRRFDLQGKWQLVVRGVDPDRIIVQSISPTGNERHYLDRIAPDSHLTGNLIRHLEAHYRRYREELQKSE